MKYLFESITGIEKAAVDFGTLLYKVTSSLFQYKNWMRAARCFLKPNCNGLVSSSDSYRNSRIFSNSLAKAGLWVIALYLSSFDISLFLYLYIMHINNQLPANRVDPVIRNPVWIVIMLSGVWRRGPCVSRLQSVLSLYRIKTHHGDGIRDVWHWPSVRVHPRSFRLSVGPNVTWN